jgi:hypothetical protein
MYHDDYRCACVLSVLCENFLLHIYVLLNNDNFCFCRVLSLSVADFDDISCFKCFLFSSIQMMSYRIIKDSVLLSAAALRDAPLM